MPLSVFLICLLSFFKDYIQPSHVVHFLMLKVVSRGSVRQGKFTKCRRWEWPQHEIAILESMDEAARQSSASGHLLWLISMHVSMEAAEC